MTKNKSTAPELNPSANKNMGDRLTAMALESMLQKKSDFEKRIVRWVSASALMPSISMIWILLKTGVNDIAKEIEAVIKRYGGKISCGEICGAGYKENENAKD